MAQTEIGFEEVVAELSERGRLEWDLATCKVVIKHANQRLAELEEDNIRLVTRIEKLESSTIE